MKIKFLLLALLPYAAAMSQSQPQPNDSQKVITRSTMVGIGATNILDTYLSEEHFKGGGISFLATVERQRKDSQWTTLLEHEANVSSCDSRNTQQELEAAENYTAGT